VGVPGARREQAEEAIDSTLTRWEESFGAAPACWQERPELQLVTLERPELEQLCPGSERAWACTRYRPHYPVIMVLAGELHTDETWHEMIAHESTHWLEACSGRHPDVDPQHLDHEAWALVR
jgi:hypothetical protein